MKYDELLYDKSSPTSIESYAKKLADKSFREVVEADSLEIGNKGGLGQLLEKHYFKYELNSDSSPDFTEAGVELKTTPYKVNVQKKNIVSKERLVLNIINYMEVHKETFETSSFLNKNRLLLLIFYLYEEGIDRLDYVIKVCQLFKFPEKDLYIIKDDWNKIVNTIRAGEAHTLSEGDTNYLGACTKGKNKNSLREQPFSEILAPQRAFSLKQSYMTHILNEYILKGKKTYSDSIIKDSRDLEGTTFEQFVLAKIDRHIGKSIESLAREYNVTAKLKSKSYVAAVATGMLGVISEHIEEFQKAAIKIKTIRLENNGRIKEHMSFPAFKFTDLALENWEESTYRSYLLNTRFLFIIYEFDNNDVLRLKKGMFWNMPLLDLENEFRNVWEKTKHVILKGIQTKKVGKREFNNLPGPSENRVAHVRPHAQRKIDTYPLPTGGHFTKQSFWLNNNYILEQIKD